MEAVAVVVATCAWDDVHDEVTAVARTGAANQGRARVFEGHSQPRQPLTWPAGSTGLPRLPALRATRGAAGLLPQLRTKGPGTHMGPGTRLATMNPYPCASQRKPPPSPPPPTHLVHPLPHDAQVGHVGLQALQRTRGWGASSVTKAQARRRRQQHQRARHGRNTPACRVLRRCHGSKRRLARAGPRPLRSAAPHMPLPLGAPLGLTLGSSTLQCSSCTNGFPPWWPLTLGSSAVHDSSCMIVV